MSIIAGSQSESLYDMDTIKGRFNKYDNERSPIRAKVAEYASLSLPWIFPAIDRRSERHHEELPVPAGSIGARCVNHLSNKLATSLFLPYMPFMKLNVSEAGYIKAMEDEGIDKATLDSVLSKVEHECAALVNAAEHKAQAVLAIKNLLITGNACIGYIDDTVQVYNFHDFVIKRNVNGEVRECIILEMVDTASLSTEVQKILEDRGIKSPHAHKSVELFTRYNREYKKPDEYVWKIEQAVDTIPLDIDRGLSAQYKPDDFPLIFLAWNLARGEDYGRGLIEDYFYSFEAHRVLSAAQMRMFAIAANKKFFVEPGAVPVADDLIRITESPPGTFHELPQNSIWTIEHIDSEVSVVDAKIQQIERELAQSFLLNSAAVRDAERVTAEEIRMQTQELEASFGGAYSKLAMEWQTPLAKLLLSKVRASSILSIPEVSMKIVTGIESMSRLGELENFRALLTDMAGIGAMPPQMLERLKMSEVWMLMASLRGIDADKIIYSEERFAEIQQAQQEQELQRQQALAETQATAQGAVALAGNI